MKKVLIGLGALIVIFLLINALLPSIVKVERTKVLNASASSIFQNINSLQKWGAWSPWSKLDPTIDESGFEGPESGVGNKHCWDSEHQDVGRGCQTIVESVPNEKLLSEMDFFEQGKGSGYFHLEEVAEGTKVTWGFTTEMPFVMRIMGLMMDGMMGPVFEQGLTDLEAVAQAEAPASEESAYEVQQIEFPETHYFTVAGSIHPDETSQFLRESFGKISAGMGDVEMAGRPSTIYHSYTDTLTQLEAAMPVAAAMDAPEGVEFKTLEAGTSLKIDYYGSYDDIGAAHEAMDVYMEANGLEMAGPVREIYVTDPGEEPDTSKWHTEVYYWIQ